MTQISRIEIDVIVTIQPNEANHGFPGFPGFAGSVVNSIFSCCNFASVGPGTPWVPAERRLTS